MLTNRRNSMQTDISRWAKRNVHKTVRQRTRLPQKFVLRKRHADASEYSHAEDRPSGKLYDDTMALQIGHEASGGRPTIQSVGFLWRHTLTHFMHGRSIEICPQTLHARLSTSASKLTHLSIQCVTVLSERCGGLCVFTEVLVSVQPCWCLIFPVKSFPSFPVKQSAFKLLSLVPLPVAFTGSTSSNSLTVHFSLSLLLHASLS